MAEVTPTAADGAPCAGHYTSALEPAPATRPSPPVLILSKAVTVSHATEPLPNTVRPCFSLTLPRLAKVSASAEPGSVTSQASSSLDIPLQISEIAGDCAAGTTPPSPASLHTQPSSHAPLFLDSSTPEELLKLKEWLQLPKQAQLEAFVPHGEFLVVSIDACASNMQQKHYEGSPWAASLTWSKEELEGTQAIPIPFPPRPRCDIHRSPGYYDDVVPQPGEKTKVTERRERWREREVEEAMAVARIKAEKVARDVERAVREAEREARKADKAAGKVKKVVRAPKKVVEEVEEVAGPSRDVKGKGRAGHKVQWAENLESRWHYEDDHVLPTIEEE